MSVIKLPAILEKVTTMKDGGIRVVVDTQEMDKDQCAEMFSLKNQILWMILASEDEKEVVIPDAPPTDWKQRKTQSQRLRAILFVWHQQLKSEMDFETFYNRYMETRINNVKSKLDQLRFCEGTGS
jgi:hypothetical protein